jgi:tetratricopeptide (TPR) repeat protein
MHDGPDVSEAGKLAELSRLEEHMAWQALNYLEPAKTLKVEDFLTPQKLTRVEAEESYVRGLLSNNIDQKEKWFEQALAVAPQFSRAAFELGGLALKRKDYRRATTCLERVPATDFHFPEARFKLGLSAYGAGDYALAVRRFREVLATFPLSEVYNDLGAAENQLNQPVAIDDFRRAFDGDQNDPVYLFNLGAALLKNGYFDEATRRLTALLDRNPDDTQARNLLENAQRRETTPSGSVANSERLKNNFNETAFRELKAMLQPKSGS